MFGNTGHRVPREAWLASLLLSRDQIRGFLGDHDGGGIRIATDFFNNEDDIERLMEALNETRTGSNL